jgi:hypothetical protein
LRHSLTCDGRFERIALAVAYWNAVLDGPDHIFQLFLPGGQFALLREHFAETLSQRLARPQEVQRDDFGPWLLVLVVMPPAVVGS